MSVRALEASEKRTLAILGLPTAALALAITVVTTYVPVAAERVPRLVDRHRRPDRHRGRARALAPARRRQLVGPAAHVDRRPAAVPRRRDSDRLRQPRGHRRRRDAPAHGAHGDGLLRRLLHRLRALPRAVPRPHRRRDRRARAVHAGDLAWHGDRHRAHRRRPARRLGDRGALRGRGDPLRGRDGRLPLGRAAACPPAPTHSRSSDSRERDGGGVLARQRRARPSGDARLPRRQRALGVVARRAEDVRLPLHHRRPGPQPGRVGRHRRRRRAAHPPGGGAQREAGRPLRPAARDGLGRCRSTASASSSRRSPTRSRSSSRSCSSSASAAASS